MLLCIAGCTASAPPPVSSTGTVRLALALPLAAPADISRVTVTISAHDMTDMSSELTRTGGEYGGVIGGIPAGIHRTFLARAYSASNTLRYEGRAEGVTITVDTTSLVSITLQDVTSPPPFSNEAPLIESLVASPASVAPGGTVSLTASARDANPGDSLGYAWTAGAGTFSAPTQASTTWTAPTTQGPVTLTLTVSDSRGAATSRRLTVPVVLPEGTGEVTVGFNQAPQVVALSSTQSTLDVGQQTSLAVSATDADGDSLGYQWASTCAGTFTGATTASATFTPTALPPAACNNCQLSVTVTDGRGGQTTGSLSVCVTQDPYLAPPTITHASQSSTTATAGQTVTFEVKASDPAAAPLSFSWTTTAGTLGTATSDAGRGRVVWTAPACTSMGTAPGITATVRNPRGQQATRSFTVTGAPACPAGWTVTGSPRTKRNNHTATLLPNGKVLVTGGNNGYDANRPELYDPATGTWSPTGPSIRTHINHQAVLLADGKVLVAGGNNATAQASELYDPATGTWSATGSTRSTRLQFASALLPDGKVLFSGGFIPQPSTSSEVYDPATGLWGTTGALGTLRTRHTGTLLPSGKVLVTGGAYNASVWASAELYDPATGTWSNTGSMSGARVYHTATRLASGKVLVAGGADSSSTYMMTAELYDPATGIWSTTRTMTARRAGHTATLLPNGKVLVVGDQSAEVYDPGP